MVTFYDNFPSEISNILQQMMRPFVTRLDEEPFPPYNIKKYNDEKCVLEIAVAGIPKDDLNIMVEKNVLTISNDKKTRDNPDKIEYEYIHKGIAERIFKKRFILGDFVEIESADLNDGILSIYLNIVIPDNKKPKQILIGNDKQLLN